MVFCHTFYARGLSRPPSCSGTVTTILMLGDCPDHHRAQGLFRPLSCSGLSRPPSCSGTIPTALVLGDYPDYLCARGLSRLRLFLGIHRFPHAALEDCPNHSPTIAQGPPSSAICNLYSHIVERHLFFSHLDLATRLIPHLPASSGTTSVRCTYGVARIACTTIGFST
jgi:hypothetical protein